VSIISDSYSDRDPNPVGLLLERLEKWTLEPRFAEIAVYSRALHGIPVGWDPETGERRYEEGPPIYPAHPYAVSFCGNFLEYSAGFHFATDDPEVLEVLMSAIDAHMVSEKYQRARRERGYFDRA
jgi:hypothetical protein